MVGGVGELEIGRGKWNGHRRAPEALHWQKMLREALARKKAVFFSSARSVCRRKRATL